VPDVKRLKALEDENGKLKRLLAEQMCLQANPCRAVDNGTELTCNAIFGWCSDQKINWHYIAPGKPPLGHNFFQTTIRKGVSNVEKHRA